MTRLLYHIVAVPDREAGVIRAFLEAGDGERLGELGTLNIHVADDDPGQKVFHDWLDFWQNFLRRKIEEQGGRITASTTFGGQEHN